MTTTNGTHSEEEVSRRRNGKFCCAAKKKLGFAVNREVKIIAEKKKTLDEVEVSRRTFKIRFPPRGGKGNRSGRKHHVGVVGGFPRTPCPSPDRECQSSIFIGSSLLFLFSKLCTETFSSRPLPEAFLI